MKFRLLFSVCFKSLDQILTNNKKILWPFMIQTLTNRQDTGAETETQTEIETDNNIIKMQIYV